MKSILPTSNSMSIKKKLLLAFGLLSGVVAATGMAGLWFTTSVGNRAIHIGENLSPQTEAVLNVKLFGTEAHLVFEEIMAGDATEDLQQVWDLLDKAQWHADAISNGGTMGGTTFVASESPVVREKMQLVSATLNKFRDAAKQRVELSKSSSVAGSTLESDFDRSYDSVVLAIDGLVAYMMANPATSGAAALRNAGEAKFRIANAHLFLEEIFAGDATESIDGVRADLAEARKMLEGTSTPGSTTQTTAALAALADFEGLVESRYQNLQSSGKVGSSIETDFDNIFESFVGTSAEVLTLVNADVDRALIEARDFRSMAIYILIAVLLASAILAALLARLAGRTVSDRISNLSTQMGALADNKLESEISYTSDKDEIGLMARALEVFRLAVVSKGQLELQAIAERALTERKARELEASFQQDLSVIIDSASAGDFSRRIDTSGKEGLSQKIGDGMNKLVGTVDGALKGIIDVISGLARGDLSRRVEGHYNGAFLQLKDDTNTMAEKFRSIARRIAGSTREVQGATREIASGVADLSARTEHQASSLEETSASMEELANTVRQNADNAQEVNKLAALARDSAIGGGQIAVQAVSAMSKIEDSSRQISDIVGLIQDIAFQTNLLALNAAVEAARAGEAGKGFAVVANEVRALAQRAGQASKDIKTLIITSDSNVRDGVALVKRAGTSLEEIVSSVKKVAGLVSDIAGATQEQSSGIEQVTRAVSGMDQMTQQNAALVEETNAALQSAQNQVDELRKMVSFFQTGEEDDCDMPTVAAPQAEPPNQVRQQFQQLARRMAISRTSSAPSFAHEEWKEF